MASTSAVTSSGEERSRELSRLLAAAAQVPERGSRLLLVSGGRGVGKTRLLESLRHHHLLGGGLVLEAWCAPTPPFHALAQLVEASVRWLAEVGAPFRLPETLRCRPGCHRLWFEHASAEAAGGPGDVSRGRFLRAAMEPVLATASLRPPIVLLHDLDRCDAGSLEWLGQLLDVRPPWAEEGNAAPLLVVASAAEEGPIEDLLERLDEAGRLERLPLGPLDLDGVRALLQSPRLAEAVLRRTGGHPEAIERLVEASPPDPERHWRQRIASLSEEERQLLEALAVLQRPASVEELRRFRDADVTATLERLQEGGWVQPVGRSATWRLAREGTRRRLLASTAPEPLRRLRERWAEVLCAEAATLPEGVRMALAAGRGELAARHAHAAADVLLARHADREAVELLVQVARDATDEAPRELLESIVSVAVDAAVPEPALPVAQRLAAADPGPDLALRLGRLFRLADHLDEAEAALRVAASTAEHDGPRLEALAELAAVAFERDDRSEAERLARLVLEEADPRDLDARLSARNTLGKLALARGEPEAAQEAFQTNLVVAEEHGLQRRAAHARINLAVLAVRERRYDEAERLLRRAQREAEAAHAPREEVFALANLAIVAMRRRHFGEALDLYRGALERLRTMGLQALVARASVSLGELYEAMGEPRRAQSLAHFASQVGGVRWTPWSQVEHLLLEGRCALSLGEGTAAMAAFEAAWQLALEQELPRHFDAAVGCARAALLQGQVGQALQWFNRLPEEVGHDEAVDRALLRAELDRARRGGAAALPAAEEAARLAEAAGDELRSLRAWILLARTRLEAEDAPGALEAYERARALEDALGARVPEEFLGAWRRRPLRRQLEELAERLAEAAPRRATLPPPRIEPGADSRAQQLRRRFPALVGSSEAMLQVLERIDRVAATDALVLVRGESGTGKELVAEALHGASRRAGGPLVKVNCAALVETLLLSELFGHEKGAFTGATARRRGRFELADGGTLFLDEIGDIAPKTQVALLRVLQERVFERVGGTQPISVDVRIVAATNRDLEALVAQGLFREDLYYRLRCVTIELPPLRERREDVPELAAHLLGRLAREQGVPARRLSADAAARLQRHDWPGNVRELENVLRGAALFSDRVLLRAEDVEPFIERRAGRPVAPLAARTAPLRPESERRGRPDELEAASPPNEEAPGPAVGSELDLEGALYERVRDSDRSWLEWKKELERACVARALREARGNITQAARLLGMKRPRLSQLVKEYGLGSLKREVRS